MNRRDGFTLIELMATLAIAAIVFSIGVPSFRGVIMDERLETQSDRFVISVKLARSAAIRYQRTATVCASANVDDLVPDCTASTDWSNGWIVWVDKDRDAVTDGNEVISTFAPTNDSLTFSTLVARGFTFDARGLALTGAGDLAVCDSRTAEIGRLIRVNSAGRTTVSRQGCS